MGSRSTGYRAARVLVAVAVLWALVEGTSLFGLYFLRVVGDIFYWPINTDTLTKDDVAAIKRLLGRRQGYYELSPELGWTIGAHGVDESGVYHSNGSGVRADREYDTVPAPGRVRLAAFGDSYTHGDEVDNPDTWAALLEKGDSNLEVLNFGVSGYGIDQAYLRYHVEGRRFHPRIVLIGFIAEDVNRGVNVWRPFYSPKSDMPVTKPRFVMHGDSMVLLPNPLRVEGYPALLAKPDSVLRALGEHDWYFHNKERSGPLDFSPTVRLAKLAFRVARERLTGSVRSGLLREDSEAVKIAQATLVRFAADVVKDGAVPIVVIFPSLANLERYRRDGRRVAEPLIEHVKAAGYRVIDIHNAFDGCNTLCVRWAYADRHMSTFGNRRVAKYLRSAVDSILAPAVAQTSPQQR